MTAGQEFKPRKCRRQLVDHGIAVFPDGIGQIINLTEYGFAFKCFGEYDFPDEWHMEIYDAAGISLEELSAKKVWIKNPEQRAVPAPAAMEVGGEFADLSRNQKTKLVAYLKQLEEDKSYSDIDF
ncbi:MAG: hypothetical protein KJO32_14170 [Deltaproteobacteria bacterium]|nr:hypothetical protein [Deltaproteobacteria bacterium]